MTQHDADQARQETMLTHIYKGMTVYDCEETTVGTVKHVYLGAVTETDEQRGLGPATTAAAEPPDNSPVENFIRSVVAPDPLPEPLRQRLLRRGFIRIDCTGLFATDRYATPEQIAGVSADGVTLNVPREALIKR